MYSVLCGCLPLQKCGENHTVICPALPMEFYNIVTAIHARPGHRLRLNEIGRNHIVKKCLFTLILTIF